MPFQSEKQRRFMWAKHPAIAKRWSEKYGGGEGLPKYKHGRTTSPERKRRFEAMKRRAGASRQAG